VRTNGCARLSADQRFGIVDPSAVIFEAQGLER